MSKQVYAGIPGNDMYSKNVKLIQYNQTMNPLDPLGLQGMQYTVVNPSNYLNKNINSQNVNQAYSKQVQVPVNQYKLQNIYSNNNVNPTHFQQIINPQVQPQQNQKIQPQIQQNQKIQPQIQQNQKIQPQMQQKHQNHHQQPQTQAKALVNQKPNNLQQQQINQNQKAQLQPQGKNPNELGYQKYAQRYPLQNQNQKINIDYNKNDQHFVNKPIYDMRKVPANPLKVQVPQNAQKQIKPVPQKPALGQKIGNNNNQKIYQNQAVLNNTKINNNKLSTIKEEEINIKQSGLSGKISQISNKSNSIKESPMEEKTPEATLPDNLMENSSQHNITQKSITESGISDFDANLSHLPTIGSIMKGNSDLLPPTKKNKYGK